MNYVNISENEDVMLFVVSKEEKRNRSKRRRFWAHNICNNLIARGEFYLLQLELLIYNF